MAEPATVQQALRRFLEPSGLDLQRQRVCSHLMACRTPAMGGRHVCCGHGQYHEVQYFGCRDRHCPHCQGHAIGQWSDRQREHLLPVRYFHVVFTVPHALNGWVQLHPEVIHQLLFQAAWGTLQAFGRDPNPKRLDGMLGMTAVLHTWGQTLNQHIHLHCLVPGGALTDDGRFGRGRAFARAKAGFAHPWRAGLDVKGSNKAPVHGHNSRTHHRRLRRARVHRSVPPPPDRYKTQIERAPA